MLLLMPCGFHLAETVRGVGRARPPARVPGAGGGPPRPGLRPGRIGLLQPPGPAGDRRHRAPGRDLRSGGVRGGLAARILDAGGALAARMPFRATFDCLWCGSPHTCRGPDDLEGWAQLCPACVGKAGDNGFLRFRLHAALTERVAAADGGAGRRGSGRRSRIGAADPGATRRGRGAGTLGAEMLAYYEARAPEYDDWYLRRGRYARGPDPRRRLERGARCRRALARRAADPWRDRRAGRRDRLVVAAAGGQGRAVAVRRHAGAARPRARAAGRARAPGPSPRPRCVGRAGSRGRRRLHRLLAEPRAARPPGRVPRHRPALAQAGRHVRLHRLAVRPAVERRGPPDACRRHVRCAASTTAASSRSSRSTTSRPSSSPPWRAPGSSRPGSRAPVGSS